jgi:hypothetical protein
MQIVYDGPVTDDDSWVRIQLPNPPRPAIFPFENTYIFDSRYRTTYIDVMVYQTVLRLLVYC